MSCERGSNRRNLHRACLAAAAVGSVLVMMPSGSPAQAMAAESCPSLRLRFWNAPNRPDAGQGLELSSLEFLPDGRRLLQRNGLDPSDFLVLPNRDARNRLLGETYRRTNDKVGVLQVEFERGAGERLKREFVRTLRGESDRGLLPEASTVGWYVYAWDQDGRLSELTFFAARAPDDRETDGLAHHRAVLAYEGKRRNPHQAVIQMNSSPPDSQSAFRTVVRLRFLYDSEGRFLGARDDGDFRIDVQGASCQVLPERLLPLVLNPFGGPWKPIIRASRRTPSFVPSLPR